MNSNRKAAIIVAILMLMATLTFMIGSGLIESILTGSDYLINVYQNKNQMVLGVLLEFVDAAAVVGIGVVMYPLLKKYNDAIAFGYAGTRIIECAILIVSGIVLLALIPLSQGYVQAAAPDASYFQTLGTLFVAGSELAFQIAMLALGVGSLPFCYLLYKSALVPRIIALLGLIGYATMTIGIVFQMFGANVSMMIYLPGGLFELIFPLWLLVKGFNLTSNNSQSIKTESKMSTVHA